MPSFDNTLEQTFPGGEHYHFLRITRSDGYILGTLRLSRSDFTAGGETTQENLKVEPVAFTGKRQRGSRGHGRHLYMTSSTLDADLWRGLGYKAPGVTVSNIAGTAHLKARSWEVPLSVAMPALLVLYKQKTEEITEQEFQRLVLKAMTQ